ncbi:UNVERIFIED_CONTAM: hypothetical protein Slati_3864500 [Sesamum latifolium]|uniref:Uncharacterized protein n=1 Tax=Sesamum latifolium TaxID=2727402 RepID=A0AAW2TPG1_9LAMI
MNRITATLLLSSEEENEESVERLFERLSVMIVDIVAACFTNLAGVILTKCHPNAIKKREKGVHEAFRLLGETGQILELLQRQEWPFQDHEKILCIEEWQAFFLQRALETDWILNLTFYMPVRQVFNEMISQVILVLIRIRDGVQAVHIDELNAKD